MEMYCGKCNKEVKDDMAFCPYCGAQIEKETDTEIKETYTRQEAFELLGNTLIFSQPEASRAWVHQGFMYLFNEVQQKILDIGDLVVKGTCEDYPQRIMEICLEYGERLLWQLLLLFGKERFASVINREVQDAMINTIQKPLYEPCEKLVETYMEIISEPEQMRVYRELRKANRMQWSGGGFGIKGAIVGAVEAGAMNVASGMAHTAINSIGNAYSKKKYQKKLDELKQKYLNKYQDIFIDNCKKVTCVAESFYEIFAVQAERARREHGAVDNLISQLIQIKSQKKRQKLLKEFGDNIETVDARSRYEKLREKVNRKRPLSEVFCKLLGFVVLGSFIVFCIICMYDSESIIGQYLCIIWMLGLPVWFVWRIVIFVKSMRKDYYKRLKDI